MFKQTHIVLLVFVGHIFHVFAHGSNTVHVFPSFFDLAHTGGGKKLLQLDCLCSQNKQARQIKARKTYVFVAKSYKNWTSAKPPKSAKNMENTYFRKTQWILKEWRMYSQWSSVQDVLIHPGFILNNKLMGFNGISWDLMGFHGI